MLEPPGPAAADHAVAVWPGALMQHATAELAGQFAGEFLAHAAVVEKQHRDARPSQNQASRLIKKMLGKHFGVGEGLTPGGEEREWFEHRWLAQVHLHVQRNASSREFVRQVVGGSVCACLLYTSDAADE